MNALKHTSNSFQGIFRTLKGFTTLLIILTLSACGDQELIIPDPPSFNWQTSIYQNPMAIAEVTEPECDIMPPLNGADPPFDGYYYYHTSPDPVVWKIKLNKSRRDLVAYISYVPDLKAPQQEQAGYYTLSIKDLISGEVALVDEMWQGYHLGFDFAGDYLIYERNFEGYLYNWKSQEKEKLGIHVDFPGLSPNGMLMTYHDLDFGSQGNMIIENIQTRERLFSIHRNRGGAGTIWLDEGTVLVDTFGSQLRRLLIGVDSHFEDYLDPFDSGLGFIVGFSENEGYLYGNNQSIANLNTFKVNRFWYPKAISGCGNRDLEEFFILPDNTFMMRKTYYISDHEKRTVYPEYHWHLFDADGSNERRVDLQL